MTDSNVMTVEEAADYLKLNPRTVLLRFQLGELPARRIGRVWRTTREQLEAYLGGGQVR